MIRPGEAEGSARIRHGVTRTTSTAEFDDSPSGDVAEPARRFRITSQCLTDRVARSGGLRAIRIAESGADGTLIPGDVDRPRDPQDLDRNTCTTWDADPSRDVLAGREFFQGALSGVGQGRELLHLRRARVRVERSDRDIADLRTDVLGR